MFDTSIIFIGQHLFEFTMQTFVFGLQRIVKRQLLPNKYSICLRVTHCFLRQVVLIVRIGTINGIAQQANKFRLWQHLMDTTARRGDETSSTEWLHR